jgi:hypothetical protein
MYICKNLIIKTYGNYTYGLRRSQPGTNKYGENPKGVVE